MESLETKIERLPPELQKEVEDFIDFLTAKHGITDSRQELPVPGPDPTSFSEIPFFGRNEPFPVSPGFPSSSESDPVMFAAEEMKAQQDEGITRNYLDYGSFEKEDPVKRVIRKKKTRSGSEDKPSHRILEWIE